MADAQPTGTPDFDQMEWGLGDDLISDVWGAVGNEEMGRMTSSPPQTYLSPFLPTQSAPGGGRAANDLSIAANVACEMGATIYGGSLNVPTYAAVARGFLHQPLQANAPAQSQPLPQTFQRQAPPSQPAHASHSPLSTSRGPPKRTRTYAEVLRSTSEELSFWPSFDHALDHIGAVLEPSVAGDFTQSNSQSLPNAITNNPNFHAGVTDPFENVVNWVAQRRITGDRLLSPLDTRIPNNHTPSPSAHLSPASIASPSSSRLSSRRSKQQIRSGHHGHRCHVCNAGFDHESKLSHHMRYHKPEYQRRHACGSCGKRFLHPKDLRRHQVVHAAKTIYCTHEGCKYNEKGFSRQDHLDRHVLSKHAVDSAVQSERPSSSAPGW